MAKKFKILLTNFEYGLGLKGYLPEYIFRSYRGIFCTEKTQQKAVETLKQIIKKENPDLICIIEIKKSQIKHLLSKKYSFYSIENKYGLNSTLRLLLLTKENCNAFVSKTKLIFKKHFLKTGTKKLLYEIDLPGSTKLWLAHFSLSRKTRKIQFDEISRLLKNSGKNSQKNIVCGDFNITRGFAELDELLKNSNLRIVQTGKTFPAYKPKKAFDLFLCSKNLKISSKVLKPIFSDHLAVVLKVY